MLKKTLYYVLLIVGLAGFDAQAFNPMLPSAYEDGIDLSNWLMSEKLDGVRGYWDGRQLLTKNGMALNAPPAFIRNFPGFELEGEIWGGRNTFEKTIGIIKKQNDHEGWLNLKFAVFDVPKADGGFEARLSKASEWFLRHPSSHAFVIAHRPVGSREQLLAELDRIEALGGEGLMLRRRGAVYTAGRSDDVLKVKRYYDMEAVVVSHLAGKGKHTGRMGSLLVELPDSRIRFKIGTGFSDEDRAHPPPVGALVTFKYYGFYESGIPKFPSFLRIRDEF
jgi:DNA ligase-1